MIDVARLPVEIRDSARAVVWKRETRAGTATKVPYCPHRPAVRAAVDDPATWGAFSAALAAVRAGQADGAGIVLGAGLVGVDLDHCRDRATGALTERARAIIHALDSYTEVSPSGTGLHTLARGVLPSGRRRAGAVEMYDARRYFTVTGAHLAGTATTIEERTAALAILHRQIFGTVPRSPVPRAPLNRLDQDDTQVLARAHAARNGAKFAALWRGDASAYPSGSEADLALCSLLAFWTGGNAAAIDRLFRQSGLYRAKWDARRGEETYGARTVAIALGGTLRRGIDDAGERTVRRREQVA